MKCEICCQNTGDQRLCRVCAEAVQRILQITMEKKTTQVTPEPARSKAAGIAS